MPNSIGQEPCAKASAFDVSLRLLETDPARQAQLRDLAPADCRLFQGTNLDRRAAFMVLSGWHAACAGPDLGRVQPTWRKALLSKQIQGVAQHLNATSRPIGSLSAMASDAAMQLWCERLVGCPEPSAADAWVVRLFSDSGGIGWYRRIVWCGRLRRALGSSAAKRGDGPLASILSDLPESWPGLAQANMPVEGSGSVKRSSDGRLGLVTVATLAGRLEARRRQWVLQHLSMQLGPQLAGWLRIGKPPWPADRLAMEDWIAATAMALSEPIANTPEAGLKPDLGLNSELVEESVEILSLVSDQSALFDLETPDLDDLDGLLDESKSSFRLGDLNL